MTSNTLVKESAAMRVHPARAAPPLKPDDQIAPHQLWSHLSVGQQQHVRQVLIGIAQQLLAHRPSHPPLRRRSMTPDLSLSQVKITLRHLERKAVIYIRQSSLKQV